MRALTRFVILCTLGAILLARAEDALDEPTPAAEGEAPLAEEKAAPERKGQGPMIIVHKTASHSKAVPVGSAVDVSVEATNVGDEAAFNVRLADAPAKNADAQYTNKDVLAPGESISLNYTIHAPTAAGTKLHLDRAQVTYTATPLLTGSGEADPLLKAYSNLIREDERDEVRPPADLTYRGVIDVVSHAEYQRMTSKRILEMIVSAALAASLVGFPYMLFRQKKAQVDQLLYEQKKPK